MASCTQTLARFAADLSAPQLPSHIRQQLVLHLIDSIGCGWAASATKVADLARRSANWLGHGNCFVWGAGQGHSPVAAAFANAMIINGLDHDDGVEINGKGLGHPGASLVPAALAALDDAGTVVDGETFLAALAAGFEINNRLIHAVQPGAESFAAAYGVAQHQAIGAAVVAGKLWGLDADGLHHAIGLAATLSCIPSLHKYNWQDRPLVSLKDGVAPAAQAGVQAAGLVRMGMVGSRDVLDGEQGYWRMRGSDCFDTQALLAGLGEDWFIRYGSFKAYPACRWLATSLECTETILKETAWGPDDIAAIEVAGFSRLVDDFMDIGPANATDAQFSLPYALAAIVHGLPPGAQWYSPQALQSERMLATQRLVRAERDDQLDALMRGAGRKPGARVTVRHRDGRSATEIRSTPLGSAERPLAPAAISRKACINVGQHLEDPQKWIESLQEDRFWQSSTVTTQRILFSAVAA